ncbi:MAG: M3 family peptidase, partial [Flavobacteriaceae bacterium]|nr:M3 family peptidase [Flavobacteriaceae bacterium]
MNPLLQKFNTKYTTAPFSKIKNEHFEPAFKEAIKMAKAEIDAIVNNPNVPTFENTIEALEFSGETLDRLSSVFFNLNSAETNEEIQKIAQEVSPLLSEFSNDIRLNKELFKRVQMIYDIKDEMSLTPEQNMLLTKKYRSFVRNGANLNDEDKT